MANCRTCGAQVEEGATFCTNCGAPMKLKKMEPTPAVSEAAPAEAVSAAPVVQDCPSKTVNAQAEAPAKAQAEAVPETPAYVPEPANIPAAEPIVKEEAPKEPVNLAKEAACEEKPVQEQIHTAYISPELAAAAAPLKEAEPVPACDAALAYMSSASAPTPAAEQVPAPASAAQPAPVSEAAPAYTPAPAPVAEPAPAPAAQPAPVYTASAPAPAAEPAPAPAAQPVPVSEAAPVYTTPAPVAEPVPAYTAPEPEIQSAPMYTAAGLMGMAAAVTPEPEVQSAPVYEAVPEVQPAFGFDESFSAPAFESGIEGEPDIYAEAQPQEAGIIPDREELEKAYYEKGRNYGTASLVLGLLGLLFSSVMAIAALVMSIIGLCLAGKAKKYGYRGGSRTAGIVLSIIGLVISAIIIILCVVGVMACYGLFM